MEYITKNLEELLKIPSPTGNTEKAVLFVEEKFKKLGIVTKRTTKGALIATIEGKNKDKEVTLSGHVDTLGAMVKEIKGNGRLKITQLGGYVWNTVEGEHVTIETLGGKTYTGTIMTTKASSHVHGEGTKTVERNADNMEIRIDEKVSSKEDILNLGINVGDFVYLDPRVVVTESGFIKSRHLDDKAGVISLLGIAKHLVDNNIKPNYTTNFFISNYEEVGHGAAATIPEKTFEFIAIDMAAPGEGQTSDEFSVTICAKDSSGPYDYELRKRLIGLAQEENLNYKIDIYPYYGSDGSAALRAGHDFKVGLIGPGVDASHSFERTHIEAIENTIKLGIAYLTK
ncbi:Putative aminopeptidase FrvX [Tissierella praeacuta DSM 18095]|uniref:Putative aminopeptidase FrvX n=1 Tax=Tissierella praeacuta DSM 18095 TaxID=1123404 RepID=A0A1M4V091_9FIRM|nr:M42 family metallopeptidase [Tissierella praeacuta]SHE62307.1 Putative aminopeptidase FrvX [Tissierella praeacuta DSM 18095]SUP02746.1 Putative aminopeptidase ysdC [Tissierella praeacuta]